MEIKSGLSAENPIVGQTTTPIAASAFSCGWNCANGAGLMPAGVGVLLDFAPFQAEANGIELEAQFHELVFDRPRSLLRNMHIPYSFDRVVPRQDTIDTGAAAPAA